MSFVPSTCNPAPYGCGCKSPSPFSMPTKTAIEWALANPVLAPGACAYESDTGKWKLGDGTDFVCVSTSGDRLKISGASISARVA